MGPILANRTRLAQSALCDIMGSYCQQSGSSHIKVVVTQRFGDMCGSSGNSGSESALPATTKIFPTRTPSASKI